MNIHKEVLYSSFINECTFYSDSTDYQYHWYKNVSQNLNYKTYMSQSFDYLEYDSLCLVMNAT